MNISTAPRLCLFFSSNQHPRPCPSLSPTLSICEKIHYIWCVVRESLKFSVSPCLQAHHRPIDHRRSLLEGTAARRLRIRLPLDSACNRVMVFTFSRHPHRRASPLLGAFFFSEDLSRAFPDVLSLALPTSSPVPVPFPDVLSHVPVPFSDVFSLVPEPPTFSLFCACPFSRNLPSRARASDVLFLS